MPSNTVTNPKEYVNVISLRNKRTIEQYKLVETEQDKINILMEAKPKKEDNKKVVADQQRAPKPKKSEFDSKTYTPSIYDPPIFSS